MVRGSSLKTEVSFKVLLSKANILEKELITMKMEINIWENL